MMQNAIRNAPRQIPGNLPAPSQTDAHRIGQPSFDCAKAKTPDEIAICSNPELAELDNAADAGYEYVRGTKGAQFAKEVDRPLIRARQSCQANVICIKERQIEAIKKFHDLGASVNASFWYLNDSAMRLIAIGRSRIFFYEISRTDAPNTGLLPGPLAFAGEANGQQYFGTAFFYHAQCGQIRMQVSGPILDNYARVHLEGQFPRFGANCGVQDYQLQSFEYSLTEEYPEQSAAEKAAAEKAAAEKAAAEKAAAEKAAAEKVAAAEKAAAERAAAEKAAAEKAASDRLEALRSSATEAAIAAQKRVAEAEAAKQLVNDKADVADLLRQEAAAAAEKAATAGQEALSERAVADNAPRQDKPEAAQKAAVAEKAAATEKASAAQKATAAKKAEADKSAAQKVLDEKLAAVDKAQLNAKLAAEALAKEEKIAAGRAAAEKARTDAARAQADAERAKAEAERAQAEAVIAAAKAAEEARKKAEVEANAALEVSRAKAVALRNEENWKRISGCLVEPKPGWLSRSRALQSDAFNNKSFAEILRWLDHDSYRFGQKLESQQITSTLLVNYWNENDNKVLQAWLRYKGEEWENRNTRGDKFWVYELSDLLNVFAKHCLYIPYVFTVMNAEPAYSQEMMDYITQRILKAPSFPPENVIALMSKVNTATLEAAYRNVKEYRARKDKTNSSAYEVIFPFLTDFETF